MQHRLDRRGAGEMGEMAENRFASLAARMGFDVKRSQPEKDMEEHWDFEIIHGFTEEHIKVDVKAMKRIEAGSVQVQSQWVWLELRNVLGGEGWVYGTKADMIAFELPDGFALVAPQSLRELVDVKVEHALVSHPRHAQYMLYRRKGRQDVLTLVSVEDIEGMAYYRWREEDARTKRRQTTEINA